MRRKLYLLTIMLCLMMAMGMSMQAQTRPLRVCNMVKIERTPETGYQTVIDRPEQYNEKYDIQRKNGVVQYEPKHAEVDVPVDSATVTLLYDLEEEDFGAYYVSTIIIYNLEWSSLWEPNLNSELYTSCPPK